jgi:DNA modification methylase/transcriptional regulator with XRE-family HTH domain
MMVDISGVGWRVLSGSCLDRLPELADESVDAVVCDPPYELGFMGKKWDSSGIAFDVRVWAECLRVLKPGGHLLAFGGSRTWHRIAVAIEDAGFDIRDSVAWLYGSGFPKSLDVSKAIDKSNGKHEVDFAPFGVYVRELREAKGWSRKQLDDLMFTNTAVSWWEGRASGVQLPSRETYYRLKKMIDMDDRFDSLIEWAEAEREIIGQKTSGIANREEGARHTIGASKAVEVDITAPATPDAQKWQGWGTALKPAFEPVIVARKPLIGTVAENVLAYGVGGLNIDGTRIGSEARSYEPRLTANTNLNDDAWEKIGTQSDAVTVSGRWPSNVMLDEFTAALVDEQSGVSKSASGVQKYTRAETSGWSDSKGMHTAGREWEGVNYGDSGGASRFFYVAKASTRDRNEGLDGLEERRESDRVKDDGVGGDNPRNRSNNAKTNFHPTVKPTDLMRQLVRLVTPPGGLVLDPFTGSGSTGKAAILEGFEFVGCELTDDYLPIIEGRLNHAVQRVANEQAESIARESETLF